MPNLRPDGFVELNRTFSDFQEDADAEQAALDSYLAAYLRGQTTWQDLLASRWSVILAEAGSGKTWELMNLCQTLREEGRAAFFIRLERLAQSSLENCLDLDDKRRLAEWRNASAEGFFFLDAVEEAKLTTRRAFEKALQSFADSIGDDGLKRVKLVITSRITGWRIHDDRTLLRTLLDLADGADGQSADAIKDRKMAPPPRVVTLNALSREQVEPLAQYIIPNDADTFLSALASHNAWAFARRPQDVKRLAEYWQETSTFGNLTELLEFDIRSRLRETQEDRQRDSDLTDDQLRAGAEAVAAAVIFGKTFSISLEHEQQIGRGTGDVLPSRELSSWSAEHQSDLLTRAMFDPAAYGVVRFHHRSVAEYLAACWLDRLLGGDLPVSDVLSLFFVRSHGEGVLIPSRSAMACWLACRENLWNQRIRQKLLEISPEALLEHGDGTQLDSAARDSLLRTIVARADIEGGVRIEASNEQLRRLSGTDIAPTVAELLLDPKTREQGLLILLRLVREGELAECVGAVKRLARNPASSNHVVTYAIAAVASAGKPEEKEEFLSELLQRPEIDQRIACQVVTDLYPDILSADGLGQLAKITRSSGRMTFPDLSITAKQAVVEKSPENHLESLLQGFVALLNSTPGVTPDGTNKSYLVSRDHIWLTPVLRAIVSRVFGLAAIRDELAEKIVDALFLIELAEELKPPYDSQKTDLQESSLAHPLVRRRFCWRRADQRLLRDPAAELKIHGIFTYYTPFDWSERDFSWMVEDLGSGHSERHRATALIFLNDLWWTCGRPKGVRGEVRRRVRDSAKLTALYREKFPNAISIWLSRKGHIIWEYLKRGYRRHLKKIVKRYWQIRNTIWFLVHHRTLKKGRDLRPLVFLFQTAEDSVTRDEAGNLEAIGRRYTKWTANAYKEGCKAYWRTFSPPLPHEKGDPAQNPWGTVIGQVGIRLDFEDGLQAKTLTAEEADRAARYGVEYLDGFPPWVSDLVVAHPGPVQSVLTSCIVADWPLTDKQAWGSRVAERSYRSSPTIQRLMAPGLLGILQNADPGTPGLLLYTVGVILRGDPAAKPTLTLLASTRLPLLPLDSPMAAPWLIIWLWLDAENALAWLEGISLSAPQSDVDALFLAVGSWMERDSLNPKPTGGTPSYHDQDALIRLLRLCYRHIRTADDIDRIGTGTYSPDARDHSQEFREALLSHLTNTPGEKAHAALLDLADDPALAKHREYVLRRAASRRRLDAEPDGWQPGEAAALASSFVQPVRSGNDLFALTIRRIRQLKDELEDADFRRREGLPTDGDEDRLQEWLARYFQERSSDQYIVHREVLVAYGKKPDLRLDTPPYPPTSIEVKWADDCSYNELSKALSDQLIGRYMRARRSRHGLLLLGWKGTEKRWNSPAGALVDFQELVPQLNDEAATILDDRWDIDGLEVIGVNFAG